MARQSFENNHFYHIYNRGVEKRVIFPHNTDYIRFIRSLSGFNTFDLVFNTHRSLIQPVRSPTPNRLKQKKAPVDIVCFCLMPNHFHLLLMQKETNGISKFMQKLGTGYTNYFNKKYQRNGVLLQGKFKAIAVESDTYLTHLSRYIHLNPLDLTEPHWKENGIHNWSKAKNALEKYRWSSYGDYIGMPRYKEMLTQDFLQGYFNPREYVSFVRSWTVKAMDNVKELSFE